MSKFFLTSKCYLTILAILRYVDFNESCECVGQVESWLNRLMDVMRATVRHQMTESVVTYEEKPREQWIFDYPAQVHYSTTYKIETMCHVCS